MARDLVQIHRGAKADIPNLTQGEMGFTALDEERLYIGGVAGNVALPKNDDIVFNVKNPPTGLGLEPVLADGSDETLKVQAIADVVPDGGKLYFPTGNYKFSNISILNRMDICGAGRGSTSISPVDSNPVFTIELANYWSVHDMTIEHDRSFNAYGILIKGSGKWFKIYNMFFRELKGYAISSDDLLWESQIHNCDARVCGDENIGVFHFVQGPTSNDNINNLVIDSCNINLFYGPAIFIKSEKDSNNTPGARKVSILNCMFHGGTSEADITPQLVDNVYIDGFSDLTIDNCNFATTDSAYFALNLKSTLPVNKSLRPIVRNCRMSGRLNLDKVGDAMIEDNRWLFTGEKIVITADSIRTIISKNITFGAENNLIEVTDASGSINGGMYGEIVSFNKGLSTKGINGSQNTSGQITIPNGASFIDVVFPNEESATNYECFAITNYDTTVWFTGVATTGFRVNVGTPPTSDKVVNWMIMK